MAISKETRTSGTLEPGLSAVKKRGIRYLITGAGGQLGREFLKKLSADPSIEIFSFDRSQLNVEDLKEVLKVVREIRPDVLINCSAYNEVDQAEEEGFEQALRVNTFGVRNLALACREVKSLLVHFSTDYVFSGEKRTPYTEDDMPSPINRYGMSKFLGEKEIVSLLESERYLILRVSWVYGEGKRNFLYKLMVWAKNQDILRIACDEFSVPTSTSFIVENTLKAIKKGLYGLFHLVPSDYTSRFEWAREYFKLVGIRRTVIPVYQEEFRLPARRPLFSAMSNERLLKALNEELHDWKTILKLYLNRSQ